MRHKLTLLLVLAVVALAFPTPIRHSRATTTTGPLVNVYCIYLGRNRDECHVLVEGGTGPFTYQWSPTPLSGGGEIAIIGCPGTAIQTISVTVTDANSETGSFSDQFQCCGSCCPQ